MPASQKPILIWLDDQRNPEIFLTRLERETFEVIWCKSYDDFKTTLDTVEFPTVVYFDHDLGDEHCRNGKHCAQLLIDKCIETGHKLPQYASQSMNPIGKRSILSLLDSFRKIQEYY